MSDHPFTTIGVIYAPFQIPEIWNSFLKGVQLHETLIILLPVRRVPPSPSWPYDFRTRRQMLYEAGYDVVFPVIHQKYPKNQVVALEQAVSSAVSLFQSARYASLPVTLYLDETFVAAYRKHKQKQYIVQTSNFVEMEEDIRSKSFGAATHRTVDFRLGVLEALHSQFPVQFPVVDIAIFRGVGPNRELLLGRKPGETNYRFPGGFKDPKDKSLEAAVLREAGEETLLPGIDPASVFSAPKYIGNLNVNDWRYADDPWSILSVFYSVEFTGRDEDLKAGDDLAEIHWVNFHLLEKIPIEGEHMHLKNMLHTPDVPTVKTTEHPLDPSPGWA